MAGKLTMLACLLVQLSVIALPVLAKGTATSNRTTSSFRNYRIRLTSLRVTAAEPTYFGPLSSCTLLDENTFSFTMELIKDLPTDLKSMFYAFEKNNRNEYVPSITVRSTLCDDFTKEKLKVPLFICLHMLDTGLKDCPFKTGLYNATRVKCTAADGPPAVPGRYWRIVNNWVTKENVIIATREVDVVVDRKSNIRFPL